MIALGTPGTAESPIIVQAEQMIGMISPEDAHFVVNVMTTRRHIETLVSGSEKLYFQRKLAEKLTKLGLDGHLFVQSPDNVAIRQLNVFIEQRG